MAHMDARSGADTYVNQEAYLKMPFSVDMAGFDKCALNYCVKRKDSPISVVGFTLKGIGAITQNGKTAQIKKGSIFFAKCTSPHEYHAVSDWEFCWVNILGDEWCRVLDKYNLNGQLVFEDFTLGEEFKELIEEANMKETDLEKWQITMQGFLYKTVLHLYERENFQSSDILAAKIKKEILKNIGRGCSQEDISREVGISVRHAQRIFKSEYGVSIHKFITEEKLRLAKNLLINTGSSIKQISEISGFENEKYFSVFFHKNCGEAPLKYRDKFGFYNRSKRKV